MLAQKSERASRILPGRQVTSLIYGALVRMVGRTNAEAIEFYIDTRLAVQDPLTYERSVRLLLGEYVGSLVIDGLKTELAKGSGTERSSESFFGQVRAAESAFLRVKATPSRRS